MIFASEQKTTEGESDSPDIEPRMFQFLDAMPVGVFIGLPGGRPYYANAEGMQLLLQDVNPSPEVLEQAKAYRACLAGTDDPYPVEREPMARALAGETVHCDDMEIHRSDGTVVPLEFWATPVFGPAGSIDQVIVAYVDISERREAENANASQAALLELAHDAIFVRDNASRITYWNSGAERTYGFPRGEALGKVSYELLHTEFPEPREDIEAKVARDGQWEGEIVHTRSDGQVIVVASRWAAHWGNDGRLFGVMEVNRDVTVPRQRAEAELLRRASALQRGTGAVRLRRIARPVRAAPGDLGADLPAGPPLPGRAGRRGGPVHRVRGRRLPSHAGDHRRPAGAVPGRARRRGAAGGGLQRPGEGRRRRARREDRRDGGDRARRSLAHRR